MTDKPTPPAEGQASHTTVSDPSRDAFERFVGLLLMSIGVFWSLTTGLCTLMGLLSANLNDVSIATRMGIPLVPIGVAIFVIGRWLKRKNAAPPEPPNGAPSE